MFNDLWAQEKTTHPLSHIPTVSGLPCQVVHRDMQEAGYAFDTGSLCKSILCDFLCHVH